MQSVEYGCEGGPFSGLAESRALTVFFRYRVKFKTEWPFAMDLDNCWFNVIKCWNAIFI